MAYSPNDRGPDIPPTRRSSRTSALWLGVVAVLLIGGIIWSQMGTSTDPTTTSSTTQQQTLPTSPAPEAPANGNASSAPSGGAQPSTGQGQTQP